MTMKKYSEELRNHALLRKHYDNLYTPVNKTNYGLIGSIDESLAESGEECSHEYIDKFITIGLARGYFSNDTGHYWDYIYETLIRSHDYKKFLEVFKKFIYNYNNWTDKDENYFELPIRFYQPERVKALKIIIKECELTTKIDTYIRQRRFNNIDDSILPPELLQILNFFNYYLSSIHASTKHGFYEILIEPKYSERVTKMVYEDFNGVLYHVTEAKNVERILKRGLQLRGSQNIYRYIEPRINFILAATNKELSDRVKKIVTQKNYLKDEYTVLKIDLNYGKKTSYNKSSYSLDFYHDLLYKEHWSVYTYGIIHPRFISVLKEA